MALAAIHSRMLPHQGEGGEIVVEAAGDPIVSHMAPGAVRDAVLLEVVAMHILMAIGAGAADVPESPFRWLLQVASEAGRCQVRAL